MSQVKIYGIREQLQPIQNQLSELIHGCLMEVVELPKGKRAHRFFPMDRRDMLYPEGRSDAYTIIEICMMKGRTGATRKKLVRHLFDRIEADLGISREDIEICITEGSPCNWGFRGMHGDEAKLSYVLEL